VSKTATKLPLEISSVDRANLLLALEAVRGCLKTTSMLWMHALGLPILTGIVVADWSRTSSSAVHRFCTHGRFSELLLRIDKQHDRWTRRRGGYLIPLSHVATSVRELKREKRIAVLLEPASPYADQYSLAGVTAPEQQKIIVEIVGPGFDASDILRGDIQPHERWDIALTSTALGRRSGSAERAHRIHLATSEQYEKSVQSRLSKIGARIRNPAYPDEVLNADDVGPLRGIAMSFLKATHQTALLRHAAVYEPIPQKYLMSFTRHVENLLSGLSGYGIHLGPTSFAASVLPKRGLIFWDFFPARKQDAASLYPAP
jgi:hypothetical protein